MLDDPHSWRCLMLVLSRKTGQQIVIGEDVHVTVVGVEGSRVILGIDAPRSQRILRSELLERPDEPIVIEVPLPPERFPPR
jgi:carbon storage regulator CsrA